jgi:hypothetical protein
VRVFATKVFVRFTRSERLDDKRLCEAIARAESGLIDAELGGGLIKQRVARQGGGRSGGYRTVIAYRSEQRSVLSSYMPSPRASATISVPANWKT